LAISLLETRVGKRRDASASTATATIPSASPLLHRPRFSREEELTATASTPR
jgi:hypothetical protein